MQSSIRLHRTLAGRFYGAVRSHVSLAREPHAARRGAPLHKGLHRWHTLAAAQLSTHAAASQHVPKAAILIIGNEVLSGKIQDTNTAWLARQLNAVGTDLVRAETVLDEPDEIVEAIHRLCERVGENGFVFTSGGIGPTHDDVTYESVAAAFGRELALHQPTVDRMTAHYAAQGKEVNAARLRMATLPEGCDVLWTPDLWVPLVKVNQVHVLPGIPRLFTQMLSSNMDNFRGTLSSSRTLYTQQGEGDIADLVSRIADDHPSVLIGSYPATSQDANYTTKLTLDSRDEEALNNAYSALTDAVKVIELRKTP